MKKLLFLIVLISLTFACYTRTTTIVLDDTCAPPCWHNIVPGQSTREEALELLPTIPGVNPRTIITISDFQANNTIVWDSTTFMRDLGGRITLVDEKVSVLEFVPGKGALTLAKAIEKFGEPEKVLGGVDRAVRPGLVIYILYPTKGIALLIHQRPYYDDYWAEIKPSNSINVVWFFDPSLFDEIIRHGPITRLSQRVIKQGIKPWAGYGEIPLIYIR